MSAGQRERKLGRETDQRRALMRGLAKNVIEHGRIETTLPKAKSLRPMLEKLITKAKTGTLANRRLIIAELGGDVYIANLLVDQIAPQLAKRHSGYLRIEKTGLRVGDRAPMAVIEFVDDIKYQTASEETPNPTPQTENKEIK